MRRRRVAIALAVALALGCGGGEDEPAARSGAGRHATSSGHRSGGHVSSGHASGHHASGAAGHAGEPVEVHGTPPDQPPARLVRFQGDVVRARGTIEAGAALEAGDSLIVRGEGRADVDLGEGGRVVLDRDTEIRIGDGGPAQIVLVRGALHALVPAGPSGPRPPLRVATPAASIDLGGSGEVYIVAHPSGAAWVASLAGMATVATGEVDARRRLRVVELTPEHALLVATRMAEPTPGPARLDDARSAATLVLETAAALEVDRAVRDLSDGATRLDESLLWLETESRHGRDLTTQHRAAVSAGSSTDSMRLQRELVTHSQQLYSLRQVATARWERLSAAVLQLGRLPGARSSDAAETRRDRVASLLGL